MDQHDSWDNYADIGRWRRLHDDQEAQRALIGAIRRSWMYSSTLDIGYQTSKPQMGSDQEVRLALDATKELRTYTSSVLDMLMRQNRAPNLGVLLFSPEGYLIFLKGEEHFASWAADNGIKIGTCWSEKTIGTNIFSLGINRKEATILRGEENYSRHLVGANYYFSPISLGNGKRVGCVAVVVRVDQHNDFLIGTAVTLARAIELQYFWIGMFQIYSDISEGSGTLVIDQAEGKHKISLISDEIFNILGIPRREVFGEELESIIDRPPANQAFWNVVQSKVKVLDETIRIAVNHKITVVNISSSPYNETRFNMLGVVLNISSIKRINKLVSRYSGNAAHFTFRNVIGDSDAMRHVIKKSEGAARSGSSVLLLGESGVGKDVIAQAIHNGSGRRDYPFVALNCAAFSKELITSELFGYEDGAYTGAKKGGSIGKFEMANGGTLFLDEIGDMPPDLQAVLLRVIEEQAFRKVGGNTMIPINVRIIAATNKNLFEQIKQGIFREDLFYRLGVIRILIPPLRERREDILLFIRHYIRLICSRAGKPEFTLTAAAEKKLLEYDWPGNVRELQNILESIISTQENRDIDLRAVQDYLGSAVGAPPALESHTDTGDADRAEIEEALRMFRKKRTRAANYLGISRSTLYRRMKEYGMI
jgi:transcriptional regulator with PAS, ATPase and Fis domain